MLNLLPVNSRWHTHPAGNDHDPFDKVFIRGNDAARPTERWLCAADPGTTRLKSVQHASLSRVGFMRHRWRPPPSRLFVSRYGTPVHGPRQGFLVGRWTHEVGCTMRSWNVAITRIAHARWVDGARPGRVIVVANGSPIPCADAWRPLWIDRHLHRILSGSRGGDGLRDVLQRKSMRHEIAQADCAGVDQRRRMGEVGILVGK
jgi:hypothetical protein